jgi:undecaprenyl-diphosphatase
MAHTALVRLAPTWADSVIAHLMVRWATPRREQVLKTLTYLADEKLMLAGASALWLDTRLRARDARTRHHADRLLVAVALAGAVPHLFKHVIDRRRPDRVVVHGPRHGVPRSGNALDSFPSGHAVHLAAAVPMLRALAPPVLRPFVWPAALALAATRIALLAHWPSDVAAGLVVGAALDGLAGRALAGPRIRRGRGGNSPGGDGGGCRGPGR